jgi:hypothetical protein
MVEKILIVVSFVAALSYLFVLMRKQLFSSNESGCSKGCGCSAADATHKQDKKTVS